MTTEIKKNKALRVFTFILVTLTVLGIGTIFLKTDYAKLYKIWFIKRYKQIEKIYNSLNINQKRQLHNLVTKGKDKTIEEVTNLLTDVGVKKEYTEQITKAGSFVVKKIINEVKKVK